MNIRFFRRFPIIPGLLWLNISKQGISFTFSASILRITGNKHGVRLHKGIRGTGLSVNKYYQWDVIKKLTNNQFKK